MTGTNPVTPAIAELLSNHERTLSETAKLCFKACHGQDEDPGKQTLEAVFQDSLQLKVKLNELEKQDGQMAGWDLLASFINCEYQLFKTNKVALRYNPWLSHWVEVVRSWTGNEATFQRRPGLTTAAPGLQQILKTRVEFVKVLLSTSNTSETFEHSSPLEIFLCLQDAPAKDFNVDEYVRMLEEEGIYEPAGSTNVAEGSVNRPTEAVQRNNCINKDDFSYELERDPVTALNRLNTLPVDLQSLELVNSLLFSGSLDDYDPPRLIQDYIQHALRYVERIGLEPHGLQEPSVAVTTRGRKDDQVRAIKLLILFVRNLLARGVINPQSSYFEIQEICVRFIWIKEVRDFRNDLEAGVW
ncbi:MAG: hypothetical protein M1822_002880 [Bathelium mastoideum]|nr:MAG: hypothetical protein M1822_002880 [Bathelium mastoideum]